MTAIETRVDVLARRLAILGLLNEPKTVKELSAALGLELPLIRTVLKYLTNRGEVVALNKSGGHHPVRYVKA